MNDTVRKTTRAVSRCACGRRKSKNLNECAKCLAKHGAARKSEAQAIVAAGICPQCGAGVHRNSALSGWYQCDQYGAAGFRKDSEKPACGFQLFV